MSTVKLSFFTRNRIKKSISKEKPMLPIELIEKLRVDYSIRQVTVAEALGVSQAAYSLMVSRKQDITVSQAIAISKLFGVSVDTFFKGSLTDEQIECMKLARELSLLPPASRRLLQIVIDYEKSRQ